MRIATFLTIILVLSLCGKVENHWKTFVSVNRTITIPDYHQWYNSTLIKPRHFVQDKIFVYFPTSNIGRDNNSETVVLPEEEAKEKEKEATKEDYDYEDEDYNYNHVW